MKNRKALLASTFSFLSLILISLSLSGKALAADVGPPVRRGQRRTLTVSEFGKITAVNITDGQKSAPYHLQFFTLEPNSLFLPVLLHADMVFYVHTGSGKLTYAEDDRVSSLDLRQGDVATLEAGSIFYLQSNLEPERTKLRIHAIFANTDDNNYDPLIGAYTSISELFLGFDKKIMQAAFEVPGDLIEAISNRTETPAIVHAVSKGKTNIWDFEAWFLNRVLEGEGLTASNKKKNKHRKYNIFDKGPDFQNCNGWSLTVAKKQLKSLKTTNMGLFMVNLNTGSMMGPHWNPRATVIAVVLQGQGMVIRVVCGNSNMGKPGCQNMRFKAREGDVFVVSRFHPMAQISFNNDSFVFMGFSTDTEKNYPQFLAGKRSVLQTVDRSVLAASFNVTNTTVDQILGSQNYSNILGCVSCAEEEERKMIDEEERKKEEEEARERDEEKKREEEAAREREEEKEREEARKREEEQRKREEEEARRREEQEREREEARKRDEEEQRKREEEEARREEQEREREEARKREEMKREEEEARRKEEEEREGEEARKRKEIEREDEEAKRREEQEQAERVQREEEEEASCESCEQKEAAARRKEEEERQRSQEEKRYRVIFEGRRALKMRSI